MEVKPVKPRTIKPSAKLSAHGVTPTPKPTDVKVAAPRSMSVVEESMNLSVEIDAPEASAGDVKTDTAQPINSSQVILTRTEGEEGMYHSRDYAAYWDGRNQRGEPVASGLYFYTLTAGDYSQTRKMLILK